MSTRDSSEFSLRVQLERAEARVSELEAEVARLRGANKEEVDRLRHDNDYWFSHGRDQMNRGFALADKAKAIRRASKFDVMYVLNVLRRWVSLPWDDVDIIEDLGYRGLLEETAGVVAEADEYEAWDPDIEDAKVPNLRESRHDRSRHRVS